MIRLAPTVQRLRELLNDQYQPSRERSLAATKLDEFELWLTRCAPTDEALTRDGESRRS